MEDQDHIPFANAIENFFGCQRCGHDLSRLPAGARFCPRCGMDQVNPASMAPLLLPEYQVPPHAVPEPVKSLEPELPVISLLEQQDFHSIMIEGYARAMNGLGVRYESGVGAAQNADEALRCYCKAARLGSEEARSRLEQRGVTSPDAPSDPPSPPEATESQNP